MDQFLNFTNRLNPQQRAALFGGAALLFLFVIGLLIYSSIKSEGEKLSYTIASNLTKNKVMLASAELDAAGIPYSVIGTGNRLTLKTNKVNINLAKIKLITSDTTSQPHSGWEIFDQSSLGTTNFENKIKYL